ncbi:MAG: exonuclease SbcCD subunit D [Candidatus Methanospirare jalkutatii]|nr:exonuclease SbcCD subunit D [Candidatus Methanospirare jalkutatii]
MRIAHIADTHLGYRQYNIEERENDIYDAFCEAIEIALKERAEVLILAGDTFDSATPPVKALHVFKEALRKIDGRMKVLTVLGDHDMPRRRGMPPHKLFDVRVLGVHGIECTEINGILFGGISNLKGRYTAALREEMAKFEKIASKYKKSVLIAHQAVEKFLPFEGAYELREGELPRNVSYYAFGHVHSRQSIRINEGIFAYAGSTEIMRKDEISTWKKRGKGFYLVDLDGEEPLLHTINLNIRPQFEEEVEAEALNGLQIPEGEKPPILHLTVGGKHINRQKVLENVEKLLRGKVLTYKIAFKERGISPSTLPETVRGGGDGILREIFSSFLGEELAELALSLHRNLSAGNIEDAIKTAEAFFEERFKCGACGGSEGDAEGTQSAEKSARGREVEKRKRKGRKRVREWMFKMWW